MGGRRIAIVGSRGFPDLGMVRQFVRENTTEDDLIISGGARGVDHAAEDEARIQQRAYLIYPAQWDRYGKKAGPLRNRLIVEACDRLVAFWDGKSSGTKDAYDQAEAAGKGTTLYQRPK